MEENKDKGLYFKGLIEKSREVIEYLNTTNPDMNAKLWEIYAGLCSYQKMYASYFESTQDLKTKLSSLEEELAFYKKQEIFDSEKREKAFKEGFEAGEKATLTRVIDFVHNHDQQIHPGDNVLITAAEYRGYYGVVRMINKLDKSALIELKDSKSTAVLIDKDGYNKIYF